MSIELFLLSMQAAGAIGDMVGTGHQQSLIRTGAELERSQIESRLEEERLAAAYSAVDAMKALRQTLASQRAVAAARGQSTSGGSFATAVFEAEHAHSYDERIKKMNLISREAGLRAAGALASLHSFASETELGQKLSQRLFQQIPFSELQKELGKPKTNKTTTTTSPSSVSATNREL